MNQQIHYDKYQSSLVLPYHALSEIEKITKNGHGMMTFGEAKSGLNDFYVGALSQGLFPAWLRHRGIDTSQFPKSKKEVMNAQQFYVSLQSLFYCIPELENIMLEIDDDFKPGYLFPYYDLGFNHIRSMSEKVYYQRKYYGSYIFMINQTLRAEESLIHQFQGRITLLGEYQDKITNSEGWMVYVQHGKGKHHYEEYNLHKGLSSGVLIKPVLGCTNDWDVYAVMILYTLSIIVRYMPNLWARIGHGDLDRYKAVIYQFSRVAERELIQIFLERLSGKKVIIQHPQDLI